MLRRARERRRALSQAHTRFRARAQATRRRPWRAVAAVAVLALLVGAVIFTVGYSRAFAAHEIAVTGVDGTIADQVLVNAAVPDGRPLARVDTAAVEQRVLKDLRIESADVGRSWPSTITIDVVLRTPVVVVKRSGEALTVADSHGVLYDTVAKAPKGMWVVTASSGEVTPAQVTGVLAMRAALPEAFTDDIRNVRIDRSGMIRFGYHDTTVKWGTGDQPALKARVLTELLDTPAVKKADGDLVVDIGIPMTPVVTGLPTEQTP